MRLAEQLGGFSWFGKMTASFFFEEELVVLPDFEDAAFAGDEGDIFGGDFLDFSRHTVGFGEVISLGAVFDFDHLFREGGLGMRKVNVELGVRWVGLGRFGWRGLG